MARSLRVAPVRRAAAAWLRPIAAAGGAALAPPDTRRGPVTVVQVKQVSSNGAADGIIRWQTVELPVPVVPLYVVNGPASDASAAFLNADSTIHAAISLDIAPGSHTFSLYGSQGGLSDFFFVCGQRFGKRNRIDEFDEVRDRICDVIGQNTPHATNNVEPKPMSTPGALALLATALLAAGSTRCAGHRR